MATYAELKQLYLTVHEISEAAKTEGDRIWDRLRAMTEEAQNASPDQLAALRAEQEQLNTDNQARKDAFVAAGWNDKQEELRQGVLTLQGDERKELEKLWGVEVAYTKDILGRIKDGISMSNDLLKSGYTIRESKLKQSPQPTAPQATATQTASPPGASSTPLNMTSAYPTAGQVVSRATNSAAVDDPVTGANVGVPAKGDKENPLHSYASYTYGLSLHLLTPDDYNTVVEKPGEYVAKHVLVASAGRWNDRTDSMAMGRDPNFGEDFYFGSLRMNTIIGVGESNRSTNAIDISFTLIEPYGLTFLDRLLAASEGVKSTNYLANPYLLQIDFFGYDDEGKTKTPLPNLTKRIPINILGMSAKVTSNGSEYQIDAMPFSHQAFTDSIVNTPVAVEITAGTVAGFFKASTSGTAGLVEALKEQRAESDPTKPLLFTSSASNGGSGPTVATARDKLYSAKSFADALNAYMITLELNHQMLLSDRYDFVFDSTIGESPLYADARTASPSEAPMGDPSKTKESQQGSDATYLNQKQRKYAIPQGASIDSVLTMLIKNSNYLTKQLAIRENKSNEQYSIEKEANKDEFLDWFKVIPKIKLRGFDTLTNTFAKEITYHVIPYEMRNVRNEAAPQGKATLENASKFYNYIYTGLNSDIIDLNIEFNAMYYTSVSAFKTNLLTTAGTDAYNNAQSVGNGPPPVSDVAPTANKSITPNVVKYRHTDQRQIATGGSKTPEEISAADLLSSTFAQSVADMLQIDLKITGDPDFIKQDDLFYAPTYNANGEVQVAERVPNGSISTDNGEVYVSLEFKTPVDIDDETGMMKYDARYKASGFSGLYRVIQVESVFDAGKFVQNLVLIRYPNQDQKTDTDKPKTERADTTADTAQAASTPTDQPDTSDTQTKETKADPADVTGKAAPEATESTEKIDPDLKAVKESAPTEAITEQTAPVATPPAPPPAPTQSAAQAELQSQINNLESLISGRQASIASHQAIINKANSRVAAGSMTAESAAAMIQSEQAAIDTLNSMLSEDRNKLATLKSQLT